MCLGHLNCRAIPTVNFFFVYFFCPASLGLFFYISFLCVHFDFFSVFCSVFYVLPSNSPTNFAHLYEYEKVTQNEEEDEEAEQNVSQTKRAKRDETRRLKTEHRKCNNMATGRAYCPLSSVLGPDVALCGVPFMEWPVIQ